MARSDELRNAKESKKDEFYTQLTDIEKEMRHYRAFFKEKVVFCNCDDPYESNFFKFFALNFNFLGLKKLISVSYSSSPVAGTEFPLFEYMGIEYSLKKKKAYKVVMTELKVDEHEQTDLEKVKSIIKHRIRYLDGDGDFRSEESIELLKEADVVITNPPFSLFREFVDVLIKYEKQFLIIGNINGIAYKNVFPLIKDNKIWLGASIHSGDREFRVPDSYPLNAAGFRVDENGIKYIRVKGVRWFTNVDYKARHDKLDLYKEYYGNEEEYPTYANYNAIDVSKTSDIPLDYEGIMGVPLTFMDKYNPEQFEIIGMGTGDMAKEIGIGKNYRGRTDLAISINGKNTCPYNRILIRHKKKAVK